MELEQDERSRREGLKIDSVNEQENLGPQTPPRDERMERVDDS